MNTKEGELFKQRVTRYQDGEGRRVPAGTPGAESVVTESKKWYARVKDPSTGRWKLVAFSKDKGVSRKKLAELETRLARGEAGLLDPYEQTMRAPVAGHVESYVADLAERGRDERYRRQTRREIDKVVAGCGATRLADLTAEKVDAFLTSLTCSARTKNGYRRSVVGLCNYLVGKKKLGHNPLLLTTRREGEVKRKRRALPAEDLQRLLDAARLRPLLEAMTIRRGPRKGERGARVAPEHRRRLERIGRHRALLYLTAIQTGLRLGTLRRVKVGHLHLDDARPAMDLPGSIMKSGRDYWWPLRSDLVDELRGWVAEEGKRPADFVFDVPAYSQTSKLLKKDLKKAGIPYQDVNGRYFDFHSFRKCTGTFLRRAKVDPSVSKLHLDHSDIRMTMEVYNDSELLDAQEALDAMPRLTIR